MPKTILMVDDDTSARQAYHDIFEAQGYAILEARDGFFRAAARRAWRPGGESRLGACPWTSLKF